MKRIRIKKGLELSQLCRLLPKAKTHEISGYVLENSVVYTDEYVGCSYPDWDRPISFHTHPTQYITIPSEQDVYNFLSHKGEVHLIGCGKFTWILRHTKKSRKIGDKIANCTYKDMVRWLENVNYKFAQYFLGVLGSYGYRPTKAKSVSMQISNHRKQLEKLGLEVEIIRVQ